MDRHYKPTLIRAEDFEAFWMKTQKSLDRIYPKIKVTSDPESFDEGFHLRWLTYQSYPKTRIHAYLLEHQDPKPRPLIIHSHGYNHRVRPLLDWARAGYHVMGFDTRGFGRSSFLPDVLSEWGYVLTGIDSPKKNILRGAVCDYMQAVRVTDELLNEKISKRVLYGSSFSGAMALMAEARLQVADLLVLAVPSFSCAKERLQLTTGGSGAEINNYLAEYPERADRVFQTLQYFDPINFADEIKCRTIFGVGLKDHVVPAQSCFALINHLTCPLEVQEFPVSHSHDPAMLEWRKFEKYWLDQGLKI